MEVVPNIPKLAQTTRDRMSRRHLHPKLVSFAGSFPYLIETCGLAHAVALAKAQGQLEYLEELAAVLSAMGDLDSASAESLLRASLHYSVAGYVHLSHDTLQAALYLSECVVAEAEQQVRIHEAPEPAREAEPRMA